MRVLFVDDDDSIRELYIMMLENMIQGVEVVERASGSDAIKLLENDQDFDFIISDYDMPNGNGGVVYSHLIASKLTIPFILFTSKKLMALPEFTSFPQRVDRDFYLIKAKGRIGFKNKIQDMIKICDYQITDREYKKIRIYNFWKFNKALCDIYIQLSSDKFVKIINKDSHYTRNDIDKYIKKELKYLYITANDFVVFSASLAKSPFLLFDENITSSDEVEDAYVTTHAMIHELVRRVGVGKNAIMMATRSVKEVINMTQKNNELLALLMKSKERRDYIYDHSYLLSCITCQICEKLEWYSRENVEKLCFSALFHDLAISNPDLAMIEGLDSPELSKFSVAEQKLFQQHPTIMAEKLMNIPQLPYNVDLIVAQHHENVLGTGIPRGLSPLQISPLVCVFIIAHDFVDQLYRFDFDVAAIQKIMPHFVKKYSCGNFKKPAKAFLKALDLNQ